MNESILSLEPLQGLGFIKLESSINYILNELKSRGDKLEHADVVIGNSNADPIYIILSREGIRLRFEGVTQKLELIEIDVKAVERQYTVLYRGNLLLQGANRTGIVQGNTASASSSISINNNNYVNNLPHITYNFINSIFGPSDVPKLIDSGKFLLLRYDGISFIFDNLGIESEETIILGTDAALNKIVLFHEKSLIESVSNPLGQAALNSKDIFPHKNSSFPSVKLEVEKGFLLLMNSMVSPSNQLNTSQCITNSDKNAKQNFEDIYKITLATEEYYPSTNEKFISFGENVESVLYKLLNPNYIFYKKSESSETDYDYLDSDVQGASKDIHSTWDSNSSEETDYFLNYYSLGIDILIDGITNKAKKFIFHTNSQFDVKFGIYNRCNFTIELNKSFFRKINESTSYNITKDNYNIHNDSIGIPNNSSPRSRKISEDSTKFHFNLEERDENINSNVKSSYQNFQSVVYNNNDTSGNICAGGVYKVENTENFVIQNANFNLNNNGNNTQKNILSNGNFISSDKDKEISQLSYRDSYCVFQKEELGNATSHNTNSNNVNPHTRKRNKASFDVGEKSFGSINESNISISLNNSDIFCGVVITPMTNFMEILNRIPPNSYFVYHKHEAKLNSLIKYYVFDGIIIEVLENFSIGSVTMFKSCK